MRRSYLIIGCLLLGALLLSIYVLSQMYTKVEIPTQEKLQSLLQLEQIAPTPSSSYASIPYLLHVTYKDLEKIPSKVYANLNQYAPDYELRLYDDQSGLQLIDTYFHPSVHQAFLRVRKGAHKADLLRYCILYVFGGVYLDVKTVLVRPLRELVHSPTRRDVTLYLVSDYCDEYAFVCRPRIYNGIMASVPRNPYFLQLIYNFVETHFVMYYHQFIRQCFLLLEEELEEPVQIGRPLQGKHNQVYLFKQHCTRQAKDCPDGLDRYGYCCYVYDRDQVAFKVRYSDFPW